MIHFYISSSELWVCSNVILMTLVERQASFWLSWQEGGFIIKENGGEKGVVRWKISIWEQE